MRANPKLSAPEALFFVFLDNYLIFVCYFPVVFVANPVYKPFAKRGFGGIGLIICYPKMNCGTNVLNSISEWFIVRPSSKSNTFDKLQTNSLEKGEQTKGGHRHEKGW